MDHDLFWSLVMLFVLAASVGFLVGDKTRRAIERLLGLRPPDWLWAWRQGYRVGAGHKRLRREVLAWCSLAGGLLCFAAGAGFLWRSAEVFWSLTVGEPAERIVVGKWAAWHRIKDAPVQERRAGR
jgi:hypothetical protein